MAAVDLEHVHETYEGGFEAVRDVGETLAIAVDMERAHFFAPGELGIALA